MRRVVRVNEKEELMQRTVCPSLRRPVKPEDLFTETEVTQLLTSFLRGKTEVAEDDCCTLLAWAQEQRLRSLLLRWVLDGSMQPHVIDGDVCLGVPDNPQN
jgi:hypothetical protein